MNNSNSKSLLDNTAMLYKQTASSRHDVCLDQRSCKCKINENCSIFYLYGQNFKFKIPFHPKDDFVLLSFLVCVYHVRKAMFNQVSDGQIFIIGL